MLLLGVTSNAYAATTVDEKNLFQVSRRGKSLWCLNSSKAPVPGFVKKQKSKFLFTSEAESLKSKLAGLKKDRSKKGKQKLKALKEFMAEGVQLCSTGMDLSPHGEALSYDESQHLLRRAGFGGTPAEIQGAMTRGLTATVNSLLSPISTPVLDQEVSGLYDGDPENEYEWISSDGLRMISLTYMLKSPNQLKEKMALFLQDYFPVSERKLGWRMEFMKEYQQLLRAHALGNFRTMIKKLLASGMSVLSFDEKLSTVGRTNNCFARHVLEDVLLGLGNFSDSDVSESARGLAGWVTAYDPTVESEIVYFATSLADRGPKTLFAGTPYQSVTSTSGEAFLDFLLDTHPEVARRFVRELYRYFVKVDPAEKTLGSLVALLKSSNYDVAPVLRKILLSKSFFNTTVMKRGVKTPAEFALGVLRTTGLPYPTNELNYRIQEMGMRLFDNPIPSGWGDDDYWLNDQWVMHRAGFIHDVVNYGTWKDDFYSLMYLLPPAPVDSTRFLTQMTDLFDVDLSIEDQGHMNFYLNYLRNWDDTDEPWLFDPRHKDNTETKIRGTLYILLQHNSYQAD